MSVIDPKQPVTKVRYREARLPILAAARSCRATGALATALLLRRHEILQHGFAHQVGRQ